MSTNDSGEPIGNGITILPNLLEGDFFIGENDMERKVPLKFKNADGTFTTLPDDSRQLVGYDITGEEVYEGDEIQQVFSVIRAEPDYYELSVLQKCANNRCSLTFTTAYCFCLLLKNMWTP